MTRTLIFVPSNNKRFIQKAKILDADIICFDLEDSVPPHEKLVARQMITGMLEQRKDFKPSSNVYVRTNPFESEYILSDLAAVIQNGIDGIVVPKVNDEKEISQISALISRFERERTMEENLIKVIPSIETAKGVVNAYSIAKSDQRVNALVFGVFDFLYDMRLDYVEDRGIEYSYARAKIPVDARAAGIEAIDSIWQKVDDIIGLMKDAVTAKKLGYSGKSIVHPNQIEPVHKIFVPSKSEIEWAKKVIEILGPALGSRSGMGAVKLEGRMVDAVHYKHAKAILNSIQNDGIQ
jgi:citrate lyase subunit beta/citryl-CoA lyase